MSLKDQWSRQRARDAASAEKSITQIMTDTRWDRVRGLRARRTLVVAFAVALAAVLPAGVYGGIGVPLVPQLIGVALLILLRLSVRVLPDSPPEYLDERQRQVQAETYVNAFRLVSSVLVVAGLVAFGAVLLSGEPETVGVLVGIDAVVGANLTLIGLLIGAPSCVYAWQARET